MPEPGPAELRTELAACLEPLLAELPAIYRDALRLTDLDGLTQAEAAPRIGLSASGMKTRVQRARAQLKALFVRCCEIELDRRGGIIDCQPHNASCDCHASTLSPPGILNPVPVDREQDQDADDVLTAARRPGRSGTGR